MVKDVGNISSDYEMTFQYGVICTGKHNLYFKIKQIIFNLNRTRFK